MEREDAWRGRHGGERTGLPKPGPLALLLAAVLAIPLAGPLARPVRAQGTLSAIESDVDQIVRRARPSMLMVIAQRNLAAEKGDPGDTPARRVYSRIGSGVAVAEDEILTTASVVLGAERMLVLTPNGLQAEAALAALDPIRNIALLRVSGLRLPPVRFAAREARVGDWAIVLGSSYRGAPTQSVGNVAQRFREPRLSLLQLTNEVYPGNSGGAALNSHGELLGLVQGELGSPEAPGRREADERRPSGMSLVIPAEDIQPAYEEMHRDGRVRFGYLGVSTRAAFVDSDTEPGLRVPIGALVTAVQPGGPADKVGLRKGDLIVAFENQRVEYPEQLARWIAAARPGTVSKLVWAHDELQRIGQVVVTESPTDIPTWMQVKVNAPVAREGREAPRRISDLQDQIKRLNAELDRLKHAQDSTR